MTRRYRLGARWCAALLLGMAAFAATAWSSTGAAEGKAPAVKTTWEPAVQLAGEGPAWFPDIALDSAGTTHIVWNTSQAGLPTGSVQGEAVNNPVDSRDFLMYGQFSAATGGQATDIAISHGGEAMRNSILVDQSGTVDVLYRQSEHVWFVKAAIGGARSASAWSEPHRISGNGEAYYSAIAQSADGTIHVLYTENAIVQSDQAGNGILRESVFYRRSTDGGLTWTAPVRLSSENTTRGTSRPQLRISGSTIVATWDDGYDNLNAISDPTQGGIRRSLDGGQTWQPIQVVTDPDGPIEQVTFAFGKDNRALLVWRETGNNVARFSTSEDNGASWSAPATIPNLVPRPYLLKHQFDRYALIADSTGVFHLLAVGQAGQPDQLALFHLEMRDGIWSEPQSIYAGQGLPEYPGVATDGGNRIVVSFFVRDNLFQVGNYRVWRINGVMDAPAVAPRPVPTIAPIPTRAAPTSTPPVTGARAPFVPGTLEPEQRASISRPPGIVSFGTGLLVVLGLVGAVVMLRLWWVRRY